MATPAAVAMTLLALDLRILNRRLICFSLTARG
jgi:hypothetical protein